MGICIKCRRKLLLTAIKDHDYFIARTIRSSSQLELSKLGSRGSAGGSMCALLQCNLISFKAACQSLTSEQDIDMITPAER